MKRSSKPSSDPNVAAWQTVREATGDSSPTNPKKRRRKNQQERSSRKSEEGKRTR